MKNSVIDYEEILYSGRLASKSRII